jgi:hypothetical protein
MKIIVILFLSILFFSCSDDLINPEVIPTSGEITINSDIINSKISGFNFELAKIITYPNTRSIKPDILVLVQQNENGNLLGVFFGTPELFPSFKLLSEYSNIDSANIFFDNYNEVIDTTFNDLAIPVRNNQIWIVKTINNKYGKILIKNTTYYEKYSEGYAPTPYGEATIEWSYQPNGTRVF